MNFPDEPLFRAIYWILDTPGLGGIVAILIVGGLLTAFGLTLFWITRAASHDESDEYPYPTSGLLNH